MAAFVSGYLAPGVYDRTLLDPNVASLLGGLRIPVVVGTADEEKMLLRQEIVRGSSASIDNKAVNEDVSAQADGSNTVFQVLNYPLVDGTGSGVITNRVIDVVVKANDLPIPVTFVDGVNGRVTTQLPPLATDKVTVTYFFKLTDTLVKNEDISSQFDGVTKIFYTAHRPIVNGNGSGIPTTEVTDIIVTVNGAQVAVSVLDGVNGKVTLVSVPLISDVVKVTYNFNMFTNSYDLLPQDGLTKIVSAGDAPDLNNYVEGLDFVILDGNKIQWGNAAVLSINTHTPGSAFFNEAKIARILEDDQILKENVSSQFTGSQSVCVVAYSPIVDGNGRGITTFDPTKVQAYVNGAQVSVTRVDGDTGTVHLGVIPAALSLVQVSYYRNQIEDDTYTLTISVVGAAGTGSYTLSSALKGAMATAKQTSFVGPVTPVYSTPLKASKNLAKTEIVTVTFTTSTDFTVTSSLGAPGSNGTGLTGQTYVDTNTGLQFTVQPNALYNNTEIITLNVLLGGAFLTGTTPTHVIPGVQMTVSDTLGTAVADKTDIITYNKSGAEPKVGSLYYMSYFFKKTDFNPKIFTNFNDLIAEYGPLTIDNQITLSAALMMINGAQAVMCKQILKQPGKEIASDSAFIFALKELEKPILGVKPAVIHLVTTSATVITALKTHLAQLSSERRRSERTAFVGFAVGTEPTVAAQFARALSYSRICAIYPDGAIIGITDEFGNEVEYILDGSYIAAAMAGLNVSSLVDVAEPMTRKNITGFKKLIRAMDEVEMDETAAAGVTVIQDESGVMKIRHALTTDMSNAFTKSPNIQTIIDEVQKQTRVALDRYIGSKFLPTLVNDVTATMVALMSSLKSSSIIANFTGITAQASPTDPNFMVVEGFYQPIFELSYIRVTFNLRTKL